MSQRGEYLAKAAEARRKLSAVRSSPLRLYYQEQIARWEKLAEQAGKEEPSEGTDTP